MGEETPKDQSQEKEEIEEWELVDVTPETTSDSPKLPSVSIPATNRTTNRTSTETRVKIHKLTECPHCKGDLGYDKGKNLYFCEKCGKIYQV